MENTKNNSYMKLIPVMLCFFAMGFVDLVGIASNYVKADLGLTDSQANIFPSLVFFLVARHWQCVDADIAQSVAVEHRERRALGKYPDLRAVCKGHRLLPSPLYRYVGSY